MTAWGWEKTSGNTWAVTPERQPVPLLDVLQALAVSQAPRCPVCGQAQRSEQYQAASEQYRQQVYGWQYGWFDGILGGIAR